jgi:hypothetical protein
VRRADHEVLGEPGLLIAELEQRSQARADGIEPALLRVEGNAGPVNRERQRLLEGLELAGLETLEVLLEKLA